MSETATAPTSASAWRRDDEPRPVTLPSGNVALLRRPSLLQMMKRGEIPNPLMEAALELLDGQPTKDLGGMAEMIEFLALSCFVEPKVVPDEEAQNGDLPLSALSDADKLHAAVWAQGRTAELAPFREERTGTPDGSGGSSLRNEAERDARPE
jgi:hypothetical protein